MHLYDAVLRRARLWTKTEIVLAGVLATIATAALSALIYIKFPHVPFVNELTAGHAVWFDANKVRDVAIFPISLALFIAVFTALLMSPFDLEARARRFVSLVKLPEVDAETVEEISVVAATAILTALGKIDLYFAAAVVWHLVYRRRFHKRYGISASSIEIVVAVLAVDAISQLAGVAQLFSVQALVVSALLEEALLRLPSTLLASVRRVMAVIGHAAVAWWSLEFLTLWRVPAAMLGAGLPPLLVSAAVVLLAAAVLCDGARRAYFGNAKLELYGAAIVVTLAVCLIVQIPPGVSLPADDYHYGESVWPLWQVLAYGQRLLVDVVPAHGLSDIPGAIFAQILFGHLTGTNVIIGSTYASLVIVGLGGLTLSRLLPIGLVFFLLLNLVHLSIVLVVIYMTLVLKIVQSRHFSRLLPVYLLMSAGMSFAVGLGTAAVAASIVPFALRAGLELRRDRRYFLISLVATIALATGMVIVFYEPIQNHLSYILVSAQTNLTIYGIPWDMSNVSGRPDWSLEWRRYSWTLLIALLPIMAVLAWKRPEPIEARIGTIAGIAYLLAFILLADSYANGRIDPQSPSRAGLTGIVLWVLFAIFGASVFGSAAGRKAAVGLALVMLAGLMDFPNVRTQLLARPFERPADPPPISDRLPAMGRGWADANTVRRAEIVKEVMDTLLEADETFLNVTNRTALYFYVRRPSPIPIAPVYNAAPRDFQKRAIDALKSKLPPVALLSSDNILHDGGPLSIRDHDIYRFVIENYVPFYYKGLVFGIAKDFRSRVERLNGSGNLQIAPSSLTDRNWITGIARPELSSPWSFFMEDKVAFSLLRVGSALRFADGSVRRIEALQWPNVKVFGPPLDPRSVGGPRPIFVEGTVPSMFPAAMPTYDQLFAPTELMALPSAWGRSYRLLDRQLVKQSDLAEPVATHDVSVLGDGWYRPTGNDPYVVFDTPQRQGGEQGILGFDLRCDGLKPRTMIGMEVYWHAVGEAFSEERVIRFAARSGFQLVPMDGRISWTGARIAQLRIDLQQAGTCERFRLGDIQLFQRIQSD